jgi:hypothetical protein
MLEVCLLAGRVHTAGVSALRRARLRMRRPFLSPTSLSSSWGSLAAPWPFSVQLEFRPPHLRADRPAASDARAASRSPKNNQRPHVPVALPFRELSGAKSTLAQESRISPLECALAQKTGGGVGACRRHETQFFGAANLSKIGVRAQTQRMSCRIRSYQAPKQSPLEYALTKKWGWGVPPAGGLSP